MLSLLFYFFNMVKIIQTSYLQFSSFSTSSHTLLLLTQLSGSVYFANSTIVATLLFLAARYIGHSFFGDASVSGSTLVAKVVMSEGSLMVIMPKDLSASNHFLIFRSFMLIQLDLPFVIDLCPLMMTDMTDIWLLYD